MNKLHQIVANVLGVPLTEIDENGGPANFPQWDSAAQIEIVLCLEEEYGVHFDPEEIIAAQSVHEFRSLLRSKGVRLE